MKKIVLLCKAEIAEHPANNPDSSTPIGYVITFLCDLCALNREGVIEIQRYFHRNVKILCGICRQPVLAKSHVTQGDNPLGDSE